MLQSFSYPSSHGWRGLDFTPRKVDAAHHYFLAVQRLQNRAVEPGLRGLDRHLVARAVGELGQERVAGGLALEVDGVTEAYVNCSCTGNIFKSPVERLQDVLERLFRLRLYVGLVDLHHVGTRGKEVRDLLVHRCGVSERRFFLAAVIVVLRLL